jgi:hypothetical protein
MKAGALLVAALLSTTNAAVSDAVAPAPSGAPRVVNVTSDSEKGWLPSEELEKQARKRAMDYLASEDSGRAADAYAFLAEIDRKDQPFGSFSDRLQQFNARAGAVVERRITTVTWTKNPAQAPLPGVYAALDLVSRFTNIDRHCGYLVLYQVPSGGAFQVMREENNFLDNATAVSIASKSSPTEVDKAWASVSAHCPGYQSSATVTTPPAPLQEATSPTIGYPSVEAALAALHSKPGVVFKNQGGWTVAEDAADKTIWSFPPAGHPAYPSAVKRQIVPDANGSTIQMSVHCQASKEACDDLVRSFEQLNAQMAAGLRGHQ